MLVLLLAALSLAAPEIPYDGLDQDGDGADLVDLDGDGWASLLAFGRDCNDRDPGVHPAAFDLRGDGVDADCDGRDGVARAGCQGRSAWLLPFWGGVGLCARRRLRGKPPSIRARPCAGTATRTAPASPGR